MWNLWTLIELHSTLDQKRIRSEKVSRVHDLKSRNILYSYFIDNLTINARATINFSRLLWWIIKIIIIILLRNEWKNTRRLRHITKRTSHWSIHWSLLQSIHKIFHSTNTYIHGYSFLYMYTYTYTFCDIQSYTHTSIFHVIFAVSSASVMYIEIFVLSSFDFIYT